MTHRETNARMSGRFTGRSFGAWITGAALLCALSGAQMSQAAQQVQNVPNAVRQSLANAGQSPANAPAPKTQPQRQPTGAPSGVKAPAQQQVKPPVKTAINTPAKPLAKPALKASASPSPKPSAGLTAKASDKVNTKPSSGPRATPVALHESGSKRDPFSPLVNGPESTGGIPQHLPPGKAGLMISMLRVDGIVKGPGGMIAVVTNGQERTYFLKEGDQLYDGNVQHITMNDVSFHELGKDPFGKPVEHDVNKPLNAIPGEQQ
jgi:hypothetical protein